MVGKSYEEKSTSDMCTEHFLGIVERIKADKPKSISTFLDDKVIYVRTGEIDYVANESGEIKQEPAKRGLGASLWFSIAHKAKRNERKHTQFLGDQDRKLTEGYKFCGYEFSIIMEARHQAGLLLEILRTLNPERLTFQDTLELKEESKSDKAKRKATYPVDKNLLERMIAPELGTNLDIVHKDRGDPFLSYPI